MGRSHFLLKRIFLALIASGAFLLFLVAFVFVRVIQTEDYCWNRVSEMLTDKNKSDLVTPTEEELRNYPILKRLSVDPPTRWYLEVIKCESDQKWVYLFFSPRQVQLLLDRLGVYE